MDELNGMDVWDIKGEDTSSMDLASDKRAAIERLMEGENLLSNDNNMEKKL